MGLAIWHVLSILLIECFFIFPNVFIQTENPEIENFVINEYPEQLTFTLKINEPYDVESVYFVYNTNQRGCLQGTARKKVNPGDGNQIERLNYSFDWEFKRSGVLPPGTEVYWHWEILDDTGEMFSTEMQTYQIQDDRHAWSQISDSGIILQWYLGNGNFGQELFNIATKSLHRLETDIGVSSIGDVWITIYPTPEEVREVLPYISEWAGAVAFPNYGGILMGIEPDNFYWANEVIPHEIAHLVVNQRIQNCKGIDLPTWLREGLAVFAEGPISLLSKDDLSEADQKKPLPSLQSLSNGFSAYTTEANRAYVQSGVVVEYLVNKYGKEKLDRFFTLLQNGHTVDEALLVEYGFNTNGLDIEWRNQSGYKQNSANPNRIMDNRVSPTPVPTLELWTPVVFATSTTTATPFVVQTATSPPPQEENVGLMTPTQYQEQNSNQQDGSISLGVVFGVIVLITFGFGILLLILRRGR